MGSENSLFYDGLISYLTRNEKNQTNEALLYENRELRITLQNLHNEYLELKEQQAKSQKLIDDIIGNNYPFVKNPCGIIQRCYRIIKFRDILLRQNGIDPQNQDAINALPINTKRVININLMAFGELINFNEIILRYIRVTQVISMKNAKIEADVIAQALTKNHNLEVHALQAWGYLQMMCGVFNGTAEFIDVAFETIKDEQKANEWLKNRVTTLIDTLRFQSGSAFPEKESIPNPLDEWTSKFIKSHMDSVNLSARLSANRTELYDFDINDLKKYPHSPKDLELVKGPVYFLSDNAMVWGAKLIAETNKAGIENEILKTLTGERLPTLLNTGKDELFSLPESFNSIDASHLKTYGIK